MQSVIAWVEHWAVQTAWHAAMALSVELLCGNWGVELLEN